MKVTYYEDEDTLVARLSDKPVAREVSQDWHMHISYAANGSVVEIPSRLQPEHGRTTAEQRIGGRRVLEPPVHAA